MKIKLTVSTGWHLCNHIEYCDLPCHWENLSDKEKEDWIREAAQDYLNECCSSHGELVENDY